MTVKFCTQTSQPMKINKLEKKKNNNIYLSLKCLGYSGQKTKEDRENFNITHGNCEDTNITYNSLEEFKKDWHGFTNCYFKCEGMETIAHKKMCPQAREIANTSLKYECCDQWFMPNKLEEHKIVMHPEYMEHLNLK